jgi:hypothetical protein
MSKGLGITLIVTGLIVLFGAAALYVLADRIYTDGLNVNLKGIVLAGLALFVLLACLGLGVRAMSRKRRS